MTKSQEKRITEDYARMYVALRRISAYQSPERLHRSSEKEWGLPADEAIEMAYENVIQEAKDGLRGIYKPRNKAQTGKCEVPMPASALAARAEGDTQRI